MQNEWIKSAFGSARKVFKVTTLTYGILSILWGWIYNTTFNIDDIKLKAQSYGV